MITKNNVEEFNIFLAEHLHKHEIDSDSRKYKALLLKMNPYIKSLLNKSMFIKPNNVHSIFGVEFGMCPNCNNKIKIRTYCPFCGQRVRPIHYECIDEQINFSSTNKSKL